MLSTISTMAKTTRTRVRPQILSNVLAVRSYRMNFVRPFCYTDRPSPLAASFNEADSNTDGFLDVREFTVLVAEAGFRWCSPEVKDIFAKLDRSKDGLISPEEWQRLLGPQSWRKLVLLRKTQLRHPAPYKSAAEGPASKLALAFNAFDADRSDSMDIREFTVLTHAKGLKWDDEKVSKVFNRVDRDGNGTIERAEWEMLLGPQGWKDLTNLRKRVAS